MNFADLEYNSFEDLEYKQENEPANFQQLFYIENLLRSSTFEDEQKDGINTDNLTQVEAWELIAKLKANQLDIFRDTNRFGQKDLVKHLNKIL